MSQSSVGSAREGLLLPTLQSSLHSPSVKGAGSGNASPVGGHTTWQSTSLPGSPVARLSPSGSSGSASNSPRPYPLKGTSCHQCKNTKQLDKLALCANLFEKRTKPDKRVCKKKYCENCLAKFYSLSLATIKANHSNWICPACRGICCCAACLRHKKAARARMGHMAPTAAPPMQFSNTSPLPGHLHVTGMTGMAGMAGIPGIGGMNPLGPTAPGGVTAQRPMHMAVQPVQANSLYVQTLLQQQQQQLQQQQLQMQQLLAMQQQHSVAQLSTGAQPPLPTGLTGVPSPMPASPMNLTPVTPMSLAALTSAPAVPAQLSQMAPASFLQQAQLQAALTASQQQQQQQPPQQPRRALSLPSSPTQSPMPNFRSLHVVTKQAPQIPTALRASSGSPVTAMVGSFEGFTINSPTSPRSSPGSPRSPGSARKSGSPSATRRTARGTRDWPYAQAKSVPMKHRRLRTDSPKGLTRKPSRDGMSRFRPSTDRVTQEVQNSQKQSAFRLLKSASLMSEDPEVRQSTTGDTSDEEG